MKISICPPPRLQRQVLVGKYLVRCESLVAEEPAMFFMALLGCRFNRSIPQLMDRTKALLKLLPFMFEFHCLSVFFGAGMAPTLSICSSVKQELDYFQVPFQGRISQWLAKYITSKIHIDILCKEMIHQGDISQVGCRS